MGSSGLFVVGGQAVRRPPPARSSSDERWSCDGLSFAELYEQHSAAIFAVAQRMGVPHLAADVTQEVFVHLWGDPGRFDPTRGSLRGFLVTVARNVAIDKARSETARSSRERRIAEPPVVTPDLSAAIRAAESSAAVVAALGRIDADCREAIVAAFYGGLTYMAVAAALGLPEGTIKSRIRRGLQQLRADLVLEDHAMSAVGGVA